MKILGDFFNDLNEQVQLKQFIFINWLRYLKIFLLFPLVSKMIFASQNYTSLVRKISTQEISHRIMSSVTLKLLKDLETAVKIMWMK